jgi:4-amino-4-deoxy-L-arabinose transferase-like glycosyltransferase
MENKILLILIVVLAVFLRFYKITEIPALNADEAALGYNAYSLLETGKDEHGESWPLVFKSFGDYKPGVYVYLVMPFIKLLGLTVLAVRLPGLILGVVSVWLIYEISRLVINNKKVSSNRWDLLGIKIFPLLSALMLAISPWHIHFSRGAWETQVATAFLLLGLWAFLRGLKDERWYLIWVMSFVSSIYTYHSMRVVTPLIGLGMLLIWREEICKKISEIKGGKRNGYYLVSSVVLGLMLMLPLFTSLSKETGLSRAQGVSILADTGPVWRVNEARGLHENFDAWWVRLIHNRLVGYGLRFFDNYLRHFSGNFLFIDGDEIQRNKVPGFGQLYLVSLPFVLLGLIEVIIKRSRNKRNSLILLWLLLAPIPSALTFQSPHALRAFSMIPPWTMITAMGIASCIKYLGLQVEKFKYYKFLFIIFYLLFLTLFSWDFGRYLFNYYRLLIPTYPFSSQYGFNELVTYVESIKNSYDRIYVTDRYDQPYVLWLFYSQYPPEQFQQEVVLGPGDKFGFATVRDFDKYHFEEIEDFNQLKSVCGRCLIVGTVDEIADGTTVLKEILLPGTQKKLFRVAGEP